MKGIRPLTIAIAAIVFIGGPAAVGAASPVANATETSAQDATEVGDRGAAENASADGVEPSDELPAQVADRVREIHRTIETSLDGSIDRLGDALYGIRWANDAENGDDGSGITDSSE